MPAKHRANPKTQDTYYRVYRMPGTLLTKIRRSRNRRQKTLRSLVGASVSAELPKLVRTLKSVGVVPMTEGARPAKLPMGRETLAKLKTASEETGLPQVLLLMCCLWLSEKRAPRHSKKNRGPVY